MIFLRRLVCGVLRQLSGSFEDILHLTVPDMIHGFWETYATDPSTLTCPSTTVSSPSDAASNELLPASDETHVV